MGLLHDADFLDLWESGSRRHPLDRALLALGAAFPETPFESLAAWPLGRRNRALVEMHCRCFGPKLRGFVACADCEDQMEVALDGRDLLEASPPNGETIEVGGSKFRLPGTRDLAAIADQT